MRILIDRAIANAAELFCPYGDVVRASHITAELMQDADVAIVRSVTRVNRELLSQAKKLRFVGSPTAGVNHLDLEELRRRGIRWAAAPGSNATAIADYVLSSLVIARLLIPICKGEKTLGLVGGGHAARHIAARIRAASKLLGQTAAVYCYDPFIEAGQLHSAGLVPVDFAGLLTCDSISLHCSLTPESYHLLDAEALSQLKSDCLLINTSRGEVIEPIALGQYVSKGRRLVMDVWNNEPQPDSALMAASLIATPHIAGYSRMGKHLALLRVFNDFQHFQGIKGEQSPLVVQPQKFYLAPQPQEQEQPLDYICRLLLFNYDPIRDSIMTKQITKLQEDKARAAAFTELRRNYCLRGEACEWQLAHLPGPYRQIAAAILGQK